MANPDGNPNIAQYRVPFGSDDERNDPKAARASGPVDRWSIRKALRRIGGAQVAGAMMERDDQKFIAIVAAELGYHPNKLSLNQMVAIKKYQLALKGSLTAMMQLEDAVDGKQIERKVEAKVTWAELVAASFGLEEHGDESGGTIHGAEDSSMEE